MRTDCQGNRRLVLSALGLAIAGLSLGAANPAVAGVVALTAVVSTTVQELIDGVPGSINSDRKQLGVDAPEPPLDVAADLVSTDLNGNLVSLGQGFGRFADPTRLDQANPEEFAIEVECYSNTSSVAYSVQSNATESRTVVFAGRRGIGNPPEIEFGADGTREIESRVFVTGAVVLWSTTPAADLSETRADLRFRVERSGQAVPLFDSALVLAGTETSEMNTTVTGPLRAQPISIAELAGLGADAETIAILETVEERGTLVILAIPPQEHAYSYTVGADERFTLNATLEARVRNAPDGTGVAAVLGRPFKNLADFIELGLPGVDGQVLERSLNQASSIRTTNSADADSPSHRTRPAGTALCGALGIEAAGLMVLGLFLTNRSRVIGE